ncbi:MAG: endolytic transglycosylase MltG [Gammaproteobacteria bacterium]|nr:endolytic transglycosylase MltG [Gammaproteobacteria bacterium]
MRKFFGFLILFGSLAIGWIYMDFQQFAETPLHVENKRASYVVVPGANLKAVARDLHDRGIIAHPTYLVWLAKWRGVGGNIKAGEYQLTSAMTPMHLLESFVAGKVVQYSLTLVEGWNFRQVMAAVNSHPKLVHTLTGLTDQQIMAKLGWPDQHPEGRFYPDTYQFSGGFSDAAFLQRAYRLMEQRLEEAWRERVSGLPYKTPYEALVMASIVEKETAVPAERPKIAGVFVRRLAIGMPLATDPTVIYGLGAAFDGDLRKQDLLADGPYNTYRRTGLPPTPIAMPGFAALQAALHPAQGKELYFVARGDGSHYFSATLEEHNNAVAKYQGASINSLKPRGRR